MKPWILEFKEAGIREPFGDTIVEVGNPTEVTNAVYEIIDSFTLPWTVTDIRLQLNARGFRVVPAEYVRVNI